MDPRVLYFGAVGVATAIAALVDRQHKSARYEAAILRIRAMVDGPIEYRPLSDGDDGAARIAAVQPQLAELAAHMRHLGDVAVTFEAGRTEVPLCVFADDTGLLLTHATIPLRVPGEVSIVVESYAADGENWISQASGQTLGGPFTHLNQTQDAATLAGMMASHRAFAPVDDPGVQLVTFRSIDDAIGMYLRAHDRVRAWRRTVPREELLQVDLKFILGANYKRRGARWTRRLQKFALPEARVRRR